jgi:hypothetical protein
VFPEGKREELLSADFAEGRRFENRRQKAVLTTETQRTQRKTKGRGEENHSILLLSSEFVFFSVFSASLWLITLLLSKSASIGGICG